MATDGYTPGSGSPVAADSVGGQAYQYVKLADPTVDSAAGIGTPGNPFSTADAALATALGNILTELGQKLEPGGQVALDAASLAALESITAAVSGTVGVSGSVEVANDAGNPLPVSLAASSDQATTLTDGRKTVAAAGTAEAIRGALACKWVTVTALLTNTAQVNVGGSGVLATSGGSTGTPLSAGGAITIPVDNASKVFVDARTAGEGVSFTVAS